MRPLCHQCSKEVFQHTSAVNRALKAGRPLYCGRACAGLGRQLAVKPTDEQRKAAKSAYDSQRRALNNQELCAKKREHYYANRERILAKQTIYRKAHMQRHVEYCRRPEYRVWKQQYDIAYNARKEFGEFAEAALALRLVEQEIDDRATRYEIYMANGTINKALLRRRAL